MYNAFVLSFLLQHEYSKESKTFQKICNLHYIPFILYMQGLNIIAANVFNSDYKCQGYKKPLKTSREGYNCTLHRITCI